MCVSLLSSHTLVARSTSQRYLRKSVSFLVDYWQEVTDELLPPLDAGGWFGAIDRSKTSASSAGWSYAVGDNGNFFGDEERLVCSVATSDYLVWDTPGLQAVEVIIFAKQPSVVDGVQLAVSAGNSAWKPLIYETEVSESGTIRDRLVSH